MQGGIYFVKPDQLMGDKIEYVGVTVRQIYEFMLLSFSSVLHGLVLLSLSLWQWGQMRLIMILKSSGQLKRVQKTSRTICVSGDGCNHSFSLLLSSGSPAIIFVSYHVILW